MSHPKVKEAPPLMEEPQSLGSECERFVLVSPLPNSFDLKAEPDSQPPPYSSLVGSQFQAYTPVPPLSTNSPYPTQIPPTQDVAVYNPMSQVTINDGRPFPQPDFNTTYAPTTYDPMANLPPVNLESTPDETVMGCEDSADSEQEAQNCCFKICSGMFTVLVIITVLIIKVSGKVAVSSVGRAVIKTSFKHLLQPNYNRYRRMLDAQKIDDFKDYDFIDFNDQPLFDKPFKLEESSRRRRDLKIKNRFDKKGIELSTRIVHYDTSAVKLFLTGVRLQHEPKASVAITRDQKKFFRGV